MNWGMKEKANIVRGRHNTIMPPEPNLRSARIPPRPIPSRVVKIVNALVLPFGARNVGAVSDCSFSLSA